MKRSDIHINNKTIDNINFFNFLFSESFDIHKRSRRTDNLKKKAFSVFTSQIAHVSKRCLKDNLKTSYHHLNIFKMSFGLLVLSRILIAESL